MNNLTRKQVAEKLGKAESTVSNYVTNGYFPRPKNNGLSTYWDRNVVEAWIILSENRKATLPPITTDDLNEIMACVRKIREREKRVMTND
ncbi:MAG: hypothetical protein CR975_02240 [Gammaproteobacteria bacterium]|nr:MAG: hypothetical protein CR975_02240 [Gammaproteobacteria bacterium]